MEEAKKFFPVNNDLLIDLDTTMAEHLPTESKSSLIVCQVKKKEVIVDGLSMFRESCDGFARAA
jgi:hypothetical protein